MNYSQQEFFALMEEVEFQGGEHVDTPHMPDTFRLKSSPDGPEKTQETCGCKHAALFNIPYGLPNSGGTAEMGTALACAVCDNMGQWPRFTHALGSAE